ncbi:MAG TPA: ABC transporter ATP-binding protein [Spirochaetota bacterium]|nr:ABC transporter ATP-binding protein [Spirochaetota bacterium]
MTQPDNIILSVRDFSAGFMTEGGLLQAVDSISFDLREGKVLGIVGESGCGKSVTAMSIMRLLPVPSGRYMDGQILYRGTDLLKLDSSEIRKIRGDRIAMIFQEPMTALNPVKTIGKQVAEVFTLHRPGMSKKEIETEVLNLLVKVGISEPQQRYREYPHQLSGGMRQRVMIAMALACKPDILIADEPTTALDVTIQAQILELIKSIQAETGMSVIFITHDLGVIASICDDVVVMYAGRIAEKADSVTIFKSPHHPYTRGLLESIPRFGLERKSRLVSIDGMVPGISEYPEACRFANRCRHVFEPCTIANPGQIHVSPYHNVSCHLYGKEND